MNKFSFREINLTHYSFITCNFAKICLFFSLPQTVEIKLIDVWMLATFFYPFLVITLQMSIYLAAKHQKNPKLINRLKLIGQVVLPIIALVFLVMYMTYAARVHNNVI